jgi:putative ABC transport system ATP-binding protein/lipoprotein-releasing system ATP-binding protein
VQRDDGAGPGAALARDLARGRRADRPADVSAWVLQTTNVLPERSALDNVAVAARTRGLGGAEARRHAAERLAAVGLADRVHACARVLSGGEVQRVVIARALASGRPFVLADEPTGQLDGATSGAVLSALLTTSGEAGIVVVTHDPEVAVRCDRTVRIRDGRVVPS